MEIIRSIIASLQEVLDLKVTFVIGGYVRDTLLEKPLNVKDLDLVTLEDYNALKEKLKLSKISHACFDKMLSLRFILNGTKIDLVRARKEFYKGPGVIDWTEPASLEEDSRRRDFSVNCLMFKASDFVSGNEMVVDLVGGLKDLKLKVLRVLKPNTFYEDPSRIIRALRYSAKLNFDFELETKSLLLEALSKELIFTTRSSRVILEFKRLFDEVPLDRFIENCRTLVPKNVLENQSVDLLRPSFLSSLSSDFKGRDVFEIYLKEFKDKASKFFSHFGVNIRTFLESH
ncbi:MAG: hypothetical protein NZT61_03555 [Deltaproteobacteria bacterium]|nr:hypothetical protein [Deltaproteobacteria bacterium]MCX7953014.1 hypothetical protein [Deltaproteobacteria bacterium]